MSTIGIYGAGGFGREIYSFVRSSLAKGDNEVVFIDDSASAEHPDGLTVKGLDGFVADGGREAIVALADPGFRQKIVGLLADNGIDTQSSVMHSDSELGERVSHGEGLIMAKGSQVTCDVAIGDHVHMNLLSYVAHDCVVGSFVTLSPRASINGRVELGDHVFIGANAVVLPGQPGKPLVIGEGAVIGAGAVVTKDVEPGAVVVGNPAKSLTK